jgi:hypothetical protein
MHHKQYQPGMKVYWPKVSNRGNIYPPEDVIGVTVGDCFCNGGYQNYWYCYVKSPLGTQKTPLSVLREIPKTEAKLNYRPGLKNRLKAKTVSIVKTSDSLEEVADMLEFGSVLVIGRHLLETYEVQSEIALIAIHKGLNPNRLVRLPLRYEDRENGYNTPANGISVVHFQKG